MKYGALSALLIASINMQAAQEGTTRYTILTQSPEQHIQHFGASDAWSMQFLGLWSEKQQEQIADWLFSTENDALGKPKGIGLSIWRFNLGAGSEEQGEASQIQPGTRTQCFLNADGTYDWSKQAGQRKFLKLAKQRGVPYFLAFCNSAPVFYTKNGLATNTGRGGTINLKDDATANSESSSPHLSKASKSTMASTSTTSAYQRAGWTLELDRTEAGRNPSHQPRVVQGWQRR